MISIGRISFIAAGLFLLTIALTDADDVSGCPPWLPPVNCPINPCYLAICPRYPYAICIPNNCGSCHAHFYWFGFRVC